MSLSAGHYSVDFRRDVTVRAVILLKKVLKAAGSVSGACDKTISRIRIVVEAYSGSAACSTMSSGTDEENEYYCKVPTNRTSIQRTHSVSVFLA